MFIILASSDRKEAKQTELNDLTKTICLRKSYVLLTKRDVIEILAEHGIHCLPCSSTNAERNN